MHLESIESRGLIGFYDTYREVDWNTLIRAANHSIVICVYFWDKWIKQHEQALFEFLTKPESSIQFFFSSALSEMQRLFPGNTVEDLERKINHTHQSLQNFLKTRHLPENKVLVHHVPFQLNYSMQCVDDTILLMSFFEMFRTVQIDSPLIQIDLSKAPNSKNFYLKELKGLIETRLAP